MNSDPMPWSQVEAYRAAERARLIAWRMGLAQAEREAMAQRIMAALEDATGVRPGLIVSGYFPYRGEPDVRPWLKLMLQKGVRVCLPVVVARHQPLEFRTWTPESRMERGALGILVPAEGERVTPDIALAPLVGFDEAGYRLGHGGGYFDRTLAAPGNNHIMAVGIGYSGTRMQTIHPQPHDVPMHLIVTEAGIIKTKRPLPGRS